eukprot:8336346-Pyramimonas_sp.AAC.2
MTRTQQQSSLGMATVFADDIGKLSCQVLWHTIRDAQYTDDSGETERFVSVFSDGIRFVYLVDAATGIVFHIDQETEGEHSERAPEGISRTTTNTAGVDDGVRATVDTSIPFSARHLEYFIEYSTYIPCRQTAFGWPIIDSAACAECIAGAASESAEGTVPAHCLLQSVGYHVYATLEDVECCRVDQSRFVSPTIRHETREVRALDRAKHGHCRIDH